MLVHSRTLCQSLFCSVFLVDCSISHMSLIWTNFMINPTKTNMHVCWAPTEFPHLMSWAVSHWSRIRFPFDSPWQVTVRLDYSSRVWCCSLLTDGSSVFFADSFSSKAFLNLECLRTGPLNLFSHVLVLLMISSSLMTLEWSKHYKLKISIASRDQIHLANSLFNSSTWFSNWHLISAFFKWSSWKYHIPSILTL